MMVFVVVVVMVHEFIAFVKIRIQVLYVVASLQNDILPVSSGTNWS
jgi:hypothetical protein